MEAIEGLKKRVLPIVPINCFISHFNAIYGTQPRSTMHMLIESETLSL